MKKIIATILLSSMVIFGANTIYSPVTTAKGTFSNLNVYLTAIGDTAKTLQIGNNWTVSGTITVPATCILYSFINGAKIYGSTGHLTDIITINSVFDIPPIQCFDTSITVVFGKATADLYYPEWVGGCPSRESIPIDISVNIQRAIDMVPDGGVLKFSGNSRADGRYCFQGITITSPLNIVGDNMYGTALQVYDTTANMFTVYPPNPNGTLGFRFQDLSISGQAAKLSILNVSSKHIGITMDNVVISSFFRVHVGGLDTGIRVEQHATSMQPILNFTDCVFGSLNRIGLALMLQTNLECRVIGCWFDENLTKGIYLAGGTCIIAGNHFQDNGGSHIYMESVGENVITGNTFKGGSAPFGTTYAILCYTDNNVFTGNIFDSTYSSYNGSSVLFNAGAKDNVFVGNKGPSNFLQIDDAKNMVHELYNNNLYATRDTSHFRMYIATDTLNAKSNDSATIVAPFGGISAKKSIRAGDTVFGEKAVRTPKIKIDSMIGINGLGIKFTTVDIIGNLRMKHSAFGNTSLILDSLCEGISLNYNLGTSYITWKYLGNPMWTLNRNSTGSLQLQANNRTGDSAQFKILPNYTGYSDSIVIKADSGIINASRNVAVGSVVTGAVIDAVNGIKLYGTTKVWDDMRIIAGSFDRPGTSDPALVAAGSTYLWEFNIDDSATCTVQLPQGYCSGDTIWAHVHWTPGTRGNEEGTNTVGWKVGYSWASIDSVFPAWSVVDLSDACQSTDWEHLMTPEVAIPGPGKGKSSMLLCNIKRTDTGTDDTWATNSSGDLPFLLELDFHYPIDKLGTADR